LAGREKTADDPRFHRRLFGELAEFNPERPPCLVYVENGNYIAGYDQLAADYKMAADVIIEAEQSSGLSNWTAPLVFTVRQTLELSLKGLLEATCCRGNTIDPQEMFSHRLDQLWQKSRAWLEQSYPVISQDQRLVVTDWTITNLHAVDPSGDLFRFANSRLTAFGRHKTYDRAATTSVFISYFETTYNFLSHWNGVLVAEWIAAQTPPHD